jgi:tetratricopeptide (TPR) repeat protein
MILVMLPAAAYLLVSLWKMVELKQVRELLTVCGIYVLALVIANLPSRQVAIAAQAKGDYTNMGTVARDRGMIAESIPLFARALIIDGDWQNARIGLAQSLWEMGNFDDARREFETAGVAPPDSISGQPLQDFFDNLWQYTEDNDYQGALQYLDGVFPRDADAPAEVWSARALIEDELGMSEKARDALLKAGAKDPENPDFPYHAGLLTAYLGDSARAEDLYQQAIQRYAAYAPARVELGFSALRRGDLATAETQVSELDRIRIPTDSTYLRGRVDELRRRVKVADSAPAKP